MYYKNLTSIYQNNEYCRELGLELLVNFDKFLFKNNSRRASLLSPYEFSSDNDISLDDSLMVFMCFIDEGILEETYFFECLNPSCISNRIYLDNDVLDSTDELDDPILCDDCGREYLIDDISEFVKVYFKVRPDSLTICSDTSCDSVNPKRDKNSTLQALRGISKSLKSESPSRSDNSEGEGLPANLSDVVRVNNSRNIPFSERVNKRSSTVLEFLYS